MELFSEYLKKDNMLSRIDARVKLLAVMLLLVMVLSYKGFAFPLLMAFLCLFFCIGMRIPLRIFLLRFSEPLFIAVVVLLLKFLFSGEDVAFSIHFMGIRVIGHKDGLMDGLQIASRILGAVSIVAVLGFSTPFNEFIAGLSWLRIPKGFIEILTFAYRYIFVLFEDATVIYNAQKNRLGYSNVRRGLSSFGILAGSLTLKAFEHSQNTTTSMVQRGYDGNMPTLSHKPFKASEVAFSALFLIIMGFAWSI
ncbi:MAG TPA: cobalt ECF transporter T component CbiQ [Dissulfurispiraceae bacterium]